MSDSDSNKLSPTAHYSEKMTTPTGKRTRTDMDQDLGSNGNVPSFDLRFDRYCPSCSRVMVRAALRKFCGQKCGVCCAKLEGRSDDGSLWNRCVDCDSWIKCTEKYCYNCKYQNEFYNPSKPSRLEAEARNKWEKIFKQESEDEQALLDAANAYDASQSEASNAVNGASQSEAPKPDLEENENKSDD